MHVIQDQPTCKNLVFYWTVYYIASYKAPKNPDVLLNLQLLSEYIPFLYPTVLLLSRIILLIIMKFIYGIQIQVV
ncbi:hypothetical protein F5X99DRAFT_322669 [Biscogniauxia marginata]|nr:hypothetical protein F5X99DRAFT_322669 [Biscogniauxia marginata]